MLNNKKLLLWSLLFLPILLALSGAWHFFYVWLPNIAVGLIAPANESPWEHAKLVFLPCIFYYIVLYFIVGRKYPNFVFAHCVSVLAMPVAMLLFFYGYELIGIKGSLPMHILNMAVSLAAGALLAYRLTVSLRDYKRYTLVAAALVVLLGAVFVLFTFFPPQCNLFLDRSGGYYGLPKS